MQQLQDWWNDVNKTKVCLIGCLIGLLLAYMLLFMPIQAKRRETEQALSKFQAQLTELSRYDMSAEEFAALQAELETKQSNLILALPNKADDFAAATALSATIKAYNLSVRGIKVNALSKHDNYVEQSLDCVVSGGYFELLSLLDYLYKRQPLTNVQISAINVEADGKLSVNMQVQTYILE